MTSNETTMSEVHAYERDLHNQADELERRADMLRAALMAPSMKEATLRDQAEHLRSMTL